MRAQGFEIEDGAPLAEQEAGGAAYQHMQVASDINIGLLVLETPYREIGGRAGGVAIDPEQPHIRHQAAGARAEPLHLHRQRGDDDGRDRGDDGGGAQADRAPPVDRRVVPGPRAT